MIYGLSFKSLIVLTITIYNKAGIRLTEDKSVTIKMSSKQIGVKYSHLKKILRATDSHHLF